MLAVIAYPMLTGFMYGFSTGTLLKPGKFVGLDNYLRLLQSPDFLHALWFSLLFAVFNVIGCYVLGLALALLMNLDVPFRGSSASRCCCHGSCHRSSRSCRGAG